MSIDFSTIIQNTNNVPTAEMRLIMNGVYISRMVLVNGVRINGQIILEEGAENSLKFMP
jgi:hypothetical protein